MWIPPANLLGKHPQLGLGSDISYFSLIAAAAAAPAAAVKTGAGK
jgi:hypothetical protein